VQQLRCGWPEGKMGVESEEEGGPAEEEDAPRAMEPLHAGAAGSSRGARPPGDGGKGRERCEGREPGAVVGSRPSGPARAWGVPCWLLKPGGDGCIPAHTVGVHLSPWRAGLF
jgi:hypothetical protein